MDLDLQGPEFHNHELELDPAGIQPAIRLTEGLLHTAQLTARECRITRMTAYGQNELELHRIAAIIGANIYLGRGRKLSLTWRDESGRLRQMTLPQDDIVPNNVPNKKYVIYVNNAPAFSPPGGPDHDELGEYYKVVTNATERFKLVFDCGQFENTTRVPCMSAIFGG